MVSSFLWGIDNSNNPLNTFNSLPADSLGYGRQVAQAEMGYVEAALREDPIINVSQIRFVYANGITEPRFIGDEIVPESDWLDWFLSVSLHQFHV